MKTFIETLKDRYTSSDLESRILMAAIFSGMLICLLATAINVTLRFSLVVVIAPLVMCIIYIYLIYIFVMKNNYKLSAYVSLLMPTIIGFPIIWLYNGGLGGSIPYYYIFMIFISTIILQPLKYRLMLAIQFTVLFGLMFFEIKHPYWIIPYATHESQIIDLTVSITVIITLIFQLMRYVMKEYHCSLDDLRQTKAQLESINQDLHKSSITDTLTSIYNRRYIMQQLDKIMTSDPSRYVLLMIDIDYFKSINDTYGHDVGDLVLIKISKILKAHLPEDSELARFGGEEFLAILNDNNAHNWDKIAENLRMAIESYIWKIDSLKVTISIGTYIMVKGDTCVSALKYADIALYQAKNTGRNKVIHYQYDKGTP